MLDTMAVWMFSVRDTIAVSISKVEFVVGLILEGLFLRISEYLSQFMRLLI